jgi:hypothetical protein
VSRLSVARAASDRVRGKHEKVKITKQTGIRTSTIRSRT